MLVLVDYNNVERTQRFKGLRYVVETVIGKVAEQINLKEDRIHLRLYDGWYAEQTPTKACQEIATEAMGVFPNVQIIPYEGTMLPIRVSVELAYSLAIDPNKHMFHTYRQKSAPYGILCVDPPTVGCCRTTCALSALPEFFKKQRCPAAGCNVRLHDILTRAEQKLVDAMLTADIIHYAHSREKAIAIVSSDDDLWPAIHTALVVGTSIIHVHTKHKVPLLSHYTGGLGPDYKQASLLEP